MQTSSISSTSVSSIWYVELLGTFRASRNESETITRFSTRQTAVLLAYLSCHSRRKHAREELIEMLWPEVDPAAGRLRLRVALNALRCRMEPPSVPPYSVLFADRHWVCLQAGAVTTDTARFESLLDAAMHENVSTDIIAGLTQAIGLYRGELLPGYYDDWIQTERTHLAGRYSDALHALAVAWEREGNSEQASEYARCVLASDPFLESAHLLLMRIYARCGNAQAALRQYYELESVLKSIESAPSGVAWALAEQIRVGSYTPASYDVLSQFFPPASLSLASSPVTVPSPKPPDASPEFSSLAGLPLETAVAARLLHLPASLTRFYGRGEEITRLVTLLTDPGVRLVTLTGIGGTGKTRLALETARRMNSASEIVSFDVVCFVSLSDVCDAARLPDSIAQALGLSRQLERPVMEQLTQWLESQKTFLILDNFEQLLPEGADCVYEMLQRLPHLTLLTTSRLPLRLSGEHEFPVLPFTGSAALHLSPADALGFPDVALFVDRAQTAKPAFQITARNASAIIALCRRLDGIPLAIELAASWAGTLTPSQMLPRLNRRFDLLVSSRRDIPACHQTLRAAIQWSYDRLDPDLQCFFTRLSVFRGGWTLEAAEAVCQEPDAVWYLKLLCERALIIAEDVQTQTPESDSEGEDSVRYRMLETLWEFAQEILEKETSAKERKKQEGAKKQGGKSEAIEEEQQTFLLEHARWYLARLQQKDYSLQEQENFRAAHSWAEAQPEQAELYFQLVSGLSLFWRTRGWWRAGLTCLEAALKCDMSAYPALNARIICSAASMCRMLKDYDASVRYYQQGLVLLTEVGDHRGMTDALNGLGCTALDRHQHEEARRYLQQSLLLTQHIRDKGMEASVHGNLGYVAMQQNDWLTSQEHLQQCLSIHKEINSSLAWPLQNLAELAQAQEQWTKARALFEESLAKYRQINETYRIAEVLEQLADVLEHCGDFEEAQRCLQESRILSLQPDGA